MLKFITFILLLSLQLSAAPDWLLPKIKYTKGNPIFNWSVKQFPGLIKFSERFDKDKILDERTVFTQYGPKMVLLAEAYCHPQSPVKGNDKYLKPLLKLIYMVSNSALKGKTPYGFSTKDLGRSYSILKSVYPNKISNELKTLVEKSLNHSCEQIIKKHPKFFKKDTNGSWVNGEIRYIEALQNYVTIGFYKGNLG